MRLQGVCNFVVSVFIADDYSIGVKLDCLLYQQVCAVVGCQKLHFEEVPVLSYDIKGLSSDGTRGA